MLHRPAILSETSVQVKLPLIGCLTDTIKRRILYRMKVTANISDALIEEVKEFTKKKTITEAITAALKEWLDLYHIKELNKEIYKKPLEFSSECDAFSTRETNRKR